MLWRVPFYISGYIEIEAKDEDEAWEEAHEKGSRDLVDDAIGTITIDLHSPECQD